MRPIRFVLGGALLAVIACQQPEPVAPPPPSPAPSPAAAPPLTFGLGLPLGINANPEAVALISDYFTKHLERPVQVRLFSYDELSRSLAAGEVDIAYISPVSYVKAAQQSHVKVLRRALHGGAASYVSVLFVRKDSPIKNFDGLKGKKIAWVQEGSASGNLFPRAGLAKKQIDAATFFRDQLFLQDHAKVCEAVLEKRVDVGASFADLRADGSRPDDDSLTVDGCRMALAGDASPFRVLTSSGPIPNDVIAVRDGLPEPLIAALNSAFDGMSRTTAGNDVMKKGFLADGFTISIDSDFNQVRDLILVYAGK